VWIALTISGSVAVMQQLLLCHYAVPLCSSGFDGFEDPAVFG
jgi:hypothetical protein